MSRILVVDDSAVVREVLVTYLKRAGYDVDDKGNLAEAKLCIKPDAFDLLVVGTTLPDGEARSLAEDAQRLGMPVLVTTNDEALARTLARLKQPVLMKPFLPETFLRAVAAALGSR